MDSFARVRADSVSGQTFESVEDYVRRLGGTKPINKVLIANNGIAAVKCIRFVRKWAYEVLGNEKAITFAVMTTPEDLKANAEYIRMADEVIDVPGGSNNNNYANVPLIVQTAESCRADAVWAGWGHASENPALPRSLKAKGIIFIGPNAGPMHALGDKIGSTIIAQSAGVPTIPWNGQGITANYKRDGFISEEALAQANVTTVEQAQVAARDVGFPLMVKASEGGGGKGIRMVREADALPDAFRQVQSEVSGSPIFLMRLASAARHLEVQLLADEYGQAIALSGRDCSVQRRHQKIVEEGPPLAAAPALWRDMERAAVSLAVEVGYSNAGTVEYLYMEKERRFAFLELNPRLQVEHPVTELITGVNLPAAQLHVAMGVPLHRIPDVRRYYGLDSLGDSPIDFNTAEPVGPKGHVIAARITAENTDRGFTPTSGAVSEINFRNLPSVWGYFSVDSSGRVHEFADSQIGHLFAYGTTREVARRNVIIALRELSIRGDIRTNNEYLVDLLESPDFEANAIDTTWLDARIAANTHSSTRRLETLLVAVLGAAVIGHDGIQSRAQAYVNALNRGQLPTIDTLSVTEDVELIYEDVKYPFVVSATAADTLVVACNNTYVKCGVTLLADGGRLVRLGGRSYVTYMLKEPGGIRLVIDGVTCMFTDEYDPTQLRASMSGKLARYLVEDGTSVRAGQAFAEVEVMKMYMTLQVAEAGVISLSQIPGSAIEPGTLLATVELDDPSTVQRAERYTGDLKSLAAEMVNTAVSRRPHLLARRATDVLHAALDGFDVPPDRIETALRDRDEAFGDPALPGLMFGAALSSVVGKLPMRLSAAIDAAMEEETARIAAAPSTAPSTAPSASPVSDGKQPLGCARRTPKEMNLDVLGSLIDKEEATMEPRDAATFRDLVQPLRDIIHSFRYGLQGANRLNLVSFLQYFLDVDSYYATGPKERRTEDVVFELKESLGGAEEVYRIARAHVHLATRSRLVITLLRRLAMDIEATKSEALATSLPEAKAPLSMRTFSRSGRSSIGSVGSEGEAEGTASGPDGDDAFLALDVVPSVVHTLAELKGVAYAELTLEARQMMIVQQGPSWEQKMLTIESVLKGTESQPVVDVDTIGDHALGAPRSPGRLHMDPVARARSTASSDAPADPLAQLVDQEESLSELLFSFFDRPEARVARNAASVYVRRLYRAYDFKRLEVGGDTSRAPSDAAAAGFLHAKWTFSAQPRMTLGLPINASDSVEDLASLVSAPGSKVRLSAGLTGAAPGLQLPPPVSPSARRFDILRSSPELSEVGHLVHSPDVTRQGVLGVFHDADDLAAGFPVLLDTIRDAAAAAGDAADDGDVPPPVHVVHVALMTSPVALPADDAAAAESVASSTDGGAGGAGGKGSKGEDPMEANAVATLTAFLKPFRDRMQALGVRRVTFVTPKHNSGEELQLTLSPTRLPAPAAASVPLLSLSGGVPGREVSNEVPASPKPVRTAAMHPTGGRSGAGAGAGAAGAAGGAAGPTPSGAGASAASPARVRRDDRPLLERSRTSFLHGRPESRFAPRIYTFRARTNWEEDSIVRHIEPTHAGHLELRRLSNFNIRLVPIPNAAIHVYEAEPKPDTVDTSGDIRRPPSSPGRPPSSPGRPSSASPSTLSSAVPPAASTPPLPAGSPSSPSKPKSTAAAAASSSRRPASRRKRFFVRAIGRQTERIQTIGNVYDQYPGPEHMFVEALNALNIAMGDALKDVSLPVGNNHIFLNVLPAVEVNPEHMEGTMKLLARRYAERLRRLRVSQVEFRVVAVTGSQRVPVRLVSSNPTGYVLRVDSYIENMDRASSTPVLASITPSQLGVGITTDSNSSRSGELDGRPVETPYPVTTRFERCRALAATLSDTLYAYDFIELFERGVAQQWLQYKKEARGPVRRPRNMLKVEELVMAAAGDGGDGLPGASRLEHSMSQYFSNEFADRSTVEGSASAPAPSPLRSSASGGPRRSPPASASAMGGGAGGGGAGAGGGGAGVGSTAHVGTGAAAGWRLVKTNRPPGNNTIGMVAWLVTLYTPEYPEAVGGRQVVFIANDITHQGGSFGVDEDRLFYLASEFARVNGLPRVYLAANCGARIGLAEEVKRAFNVAWVDEADPTKGYRYLYLTPEAYADLSARNSIQARRVVEGGDERYVLTDIIGERTGLGVENLRGSGTIAAETARANAAGFTLTYVTGRSVGIGAYLVRLGQRTIQKASGAPILLTGFKALNKLNGRDVYTSNLQLGGPKIMHTNGVSHEVVSNDYDGVTAILRWLSYVPRRAGEGVPVLATRDGVDRGIDVVPAKTVDPRLFLAGKMVPVAAEDSGRGDSQPAAPATTAGAGAGAGDAAGGAAGDGSTSGAAPGTPPQSASVPPKAGVSPPAEPLSMRREDTSASATVTASAASGPTQPHKRRSQPRQEKWLSGFFDRGSFTEYLDGWARTVIVGRARLGGIPMGVIVPETQTTTSRIPADPASPESEERVTNQAGGVWYPDSAYKTAQAIRDFNGEGLPLIIFANWRGFSGGQRDMFEQVLKFGSYIVEALVNYTHPVFVYIPPASELRGGAWVVVDPTINADYMEMFADPGARGGVLEPSGTAEIKFRMRDLQATAGRLDPVLRELRAQAADPGLLRADKDALRAKQHAREAAVMPIYLQVAHTFADLHDTPGRMMAKRCLDAVVPWESARPFFYFRLRRRLAELSLCRRMMADNPSMSMPDAQRMLRTWFDESLKGPDTVWSADRKVLEWLASNDSVLESQLAALRRSAISDQVRSLGMADPSAVVSGMLALVNCLPSHQREATVAALRRGILFNDPHAAAAPLPLDEGSWDDSEELYPLRTRSSRSGSAASGGGGTWF